MSVHWSISAHSGSNSAMSERVAGQLTEKDRSRTIEYLQVGKPTQIEFQASLQAPNGCTVTLAVKDRLLHSLPPALHWMAINSSEWD